MNLRVALAAVCLASASSPAWALPPTVVVPSSLSATDGCANNLAPFSSGNFGVVNGIRYQQVYDKSEFVGLGADLQITAISFRADSGTGGPNTGNIGSLEVRLSTTAAAVDALSATFASNVGANDTLVYSGAFSGSYGGGTIGSVRPFDLTITLATPFHYLPANGNLLLDIRIPTPATSSFFALDAAFAGPGGGCGGATPDTTSRVRGTTADDFTTGTPDTIGLVTQFTFGTTPVELQNLSAE